MGNITHSKQQLSKIDMNNRTMYIKNKRRTFTQLAFARPAQGRARMSFRPSLNFNHLTLQKYKNSENQ